MHTLCTVFKKSGKEANIARQNIEEMLETKESKLRGKERAINEELTEKETESSRAITRCALCTAVDEPAEY